MMPIVLYYPFLRECGPVRPVQLVVLSPRAEFNFVENLEFHMGWSRAGIESTR